MKGWKKTTLGKFVELDIPQIRENDFYCLSTNGGDSGFSTDDLIDERGKNAVVEWRVIDLGLFFIINGNEMWRDTE